jgi:5-methyltetrahydrofolate--homocysteine methyltransferase
MPGILEKINQGAVLVADGAMGTMLMQRGLKAGECPERMNLEHPDILEKIARLYIEAGADIIQTNTFGASPLKLASYSLADKTELINARAVQIARKAVKDGAFVYASCGPSGKLLKPYGDLDPADLFENYRRQIDVLIAEGVDMICFETMSDINELTTAIKAAKSVSSTIPIGASMTFDQTPRGFYTIMGTSIEQAAETLANAGADIIGSNCGNGIVNMVAIAAEFRNHTSLPLIIQANAGLPELKGDAAVYPETPEFMGNEIKKLFNYNVNIIGGCCGTTPAHIKEFRKVVDRYNHINLPKN